jgi:hypothetical protein
MSILLTITAIMPTITATLSRPKLRAGERALVGPAVRRQPGLGRLRQWRTYDAVSSNGSANGHGGAQVRSLSITEIASQIVSELAGCNIICVGPVVRGDAPTMPPFYCALCSADDGGFFTLICGGEDLDDAQRARALVRDRLRGMGRCVLEFTTELRMAREIASLWPGPQTEVMLATIESGR